MKSASGAWASTALVILGVAIAWLAFYKINAVAFAHFEHSARANWVFLPAALRVIAVLLFRGKGAAGLMLGAYFTMPHDAASSLPHELLIAASSALAPLLAILLCQRFFPIADDLAGLRGCHIMALSVANAFANSCVLTLSIALSGELLGDFGQVWAIFVGDTLGAAIVLSVIATALWLLPMFLRRRAR